MLSSPTNGDSMAMRCLCGGRQEDTQRSITEGKGVTFAHAENGVRRLINVLGGR